jgi:ribosomal protein S18 acetylase RimI-like enzyme
MLTHRPLEVRSELEPDVFARIAAYLRATAIRDADHHVHLAPFTARFASDSDNLFRNYAIPDDGAAPTREDIAVLVDLFERRGRRPRLEYLPRAAPALESALVAAGFTVEGRPPLMTCARDAVRPLPVPDGIELIVPAGERELRDTAVVQHEAYGEPPPGDRDVDRLRRTLEAGGMVVLARDAVSHDPAGAGIYPVPYEGATEIAGIGVSPPFRRRGIAAALTARLLEEAFAAGIAAPWLMAAGQDEARIYARAGFVTRGEVLHISRP